MRSLACILVWGGMITVSYAQSINDRVEELLVDFGAKAEEHYSRPFAVLATGKKTHVSERDGVKEELIWWVNCQKGKLTYQARGRRVRSKNMLVDLWKQRRFDGDKLEYKRRLANDDAMSIDDEGEMKRSDKLIPVWPFELSLAPASDLNIAQRRRAIWIPFFLQNDVEKAEFSDGELLVELRTEADNQLLRFNIKFGGADQNFLPVSTEGYFRTTSGSNKDWWYTGGVFTEWEKQSGEWLPKKMDIVGVLGDRTEYHYEMDFQWLVGDQVKKEIVISPSKDWRIGLTKVFETTWYKAGRVAFTNDGEN